MQLFNHDQKEILKIQERLCLFRYINLPGSLSFGKGLITFGDPSYAILFGSSTAIGGDLQHPNLVPNEPVIGIQRSPPCTDCPSTQISPGAQLSYDESKLHSTG